MSTVKKYAKRKFDLTSKDVSDVEFKEWNAEIAQLINTDRCKVWGWDLPIIKSPQAFSTFLMDNNMTDSSVDTSHSYVLHSWCTKDKSLCMQSTRNPIASGKLGEPVNLNSINIYGIESKNVAQLAKKFTKVLARWDGTEEYRCNEV